MQFEALTQRVIFEFCRDVLKAKVEEFDESLDFKKFYDFWLPEHNLCIEAEVKDVKYWSEGKVIYYDINVPARKIKNEPGLYLQIASNGLWLWVARMEDVQTCPIAKQSNKFMFGEDFLKVDQRHFPLMYYERVDRRWRERQK
jgi:hypothetical protein